MIGEDIKFQQKKIHGRRCTWNWRDKWRCQLKWLFWENILLLELFCFLKVQLYLCIYLFLYFSIHFFLILLFFSAEKTFKVFVWISSIKTLGRAVDKLLNDSRVNSHGQFIFGKQSLSLFRGNTTFQGNRRCNFSHFLDMVKTGLFFTFFSLKVNC